MNIHNEAELILVIGRLEGKLDAFLQMHRSHEERLKSYENRIRLLENSRSYVYGIAAVLGFIASFSLTVITKLF